MTKVKSVAFRCAYDGAGSGLNENLATWEPDRDITIIGSVLAVHTQNEFIEAELSLSPKAYAIQAYSGLGGAAEWQSEFGAHGVINYVAMEMSGAIANGVYNCEYVNTAMFPENHGMDVDEGETISIHAAHNNVAGSTAIICGCIYYTERKKSRK